MSRVHKTRALIAKLDQVIKDKWQTYQYRRVPIDLGPDRYTDTNTNGQWDSGEPLLHDWNNNGNYDPAPNPPQADLLRLSALHDLIRMELPERYTDIVQIPDSSITSTPQGPVAAMPAPSLWNGYFRRIKTAVTSTTPPTVENQGAEMLYMIVMAALASDEDSRDVFKPGNIGDTDEDGMPEFIDGWGRPIKFLRWAPGFQSDLQIIASGTNPTLNTVSPNTVTVQVGTGALSSANGAYVGGTMAVIDGTSTLNPKPIAGDRTARITGYQPTTRTFTCTSPSTVKPFNGTSPSGNEQVVIMAPDPFDPTDMDSFNVLSSKVFSFAIYPLIYSPGPDGQFGILADVDDVVSGTGPFVYGNTTIKDNPYVYHPSTSPTPNLMFGAGVTLANERPNASLDNIHNHLQATR